MAVTRTGRGGSDRSSLGTPRRTVRVEAHAPSVGHPKGRPGMTAHEEETKMNSNTGEIRQFPASELEALQDPWTPLTRAELRHVEPLPQAERPEALRVLAIDPGSERSGWVVLDTATGAVVGHGKSPNASLFADAAGRHVDAVVIEWITGYGATVGAETFEACFWAGRFAESAERVGWTVDRITRKEVIVALHGRQRRHGDPTADAMIRAALIDLYGGIGGKAAAIGTKAAPGPLYGITADRWAALAVAVTWSDRNTPGAIP